MLVPAQFRNRGKDHRTNRRRDVQCPHYPPIPLHQPGSPTPAFLPLPWARPAATAMALSSPLRPSREPRARLLAPPRKLEKVFEGRNAVKIAPLIEERNQTGHFWQRCQAASMKGT